MLTVMALQPCFSVFVSLMTPFPSYLGWMHGWRGKGKGREGNEREEDGRGGGRGLNRRGGEGRGEIIYIGPVLLLHGS